MQKYNFCRKSAPGAKPGPPPTLSYYLAVILAIFFALAKLFFMASCSPPAQPGSAAYAIDRYETIYKHKMPAENPAGRISVPMERPAPFDPINRKPFSTDSTTKK